MKIKKKNENMRKGPKEKINKYFFLVLFKSKMREGKEQKSFFSFLSEK
jgi:hypothetical protein